MSTVFAIIRKGIEVKSDDYGNILNDEDIGDKLTAVAHRGSWGWVWLSSEDILSHLPDDTPVHPTDNTSQGIHTIGDIRKQLKIE